MQNINEERIEQVAQEAFNKVADSRRWQTAIAKALGEIKSNPFMHYTGDALLILSPSNEIYEANGTCQCIAYRKGFPCWHRAASRLVKNYLAAEEAAAASQRQAVNGRMAEFYGIA